MEQLKAVNFGNVSKEWKMNGELKIVHKLQKLIVSIVHLNKFLVMVLGLVLIWMLSLLKCLLNITPMVIMLSLLKMETKNTSKILNILWISMMMVMLMPVKFMNMSWKSKDNIDKNIVKVGVLHTVIAQFLQ